MKALGILLLPLLVSALAMAADLGTKKVLTLSAAKQIAAAAESFARQNNWNVVIAILDDGGHLIYLQRMDDTQIGSVEVAQQKGRTAVNFRRPSKVFQDLVTGGSPQMAQLPGALAVEGGLPLIVEGAVVGAIGVSGVTSAQDGQIAAAGAKALEQ